MARSFLEDLTAEYLQYFKGYFIKRNVVIEGHGGKSKGGILGEIDIVAYDKDNDRHYFYELSGDADSLAERLKRLRENKIPAIQKYTGNNRIEKNCFNAIFVFWESGFGHRKQTVAAIKQFEEEYAKKGFDLTILGQPDFMKVVFNAVCDEQKTNRGTRSEKEIPTEFPLLRLMQLLIKYGLIELPGTS